MSKNDGGAAFPRTGFVTCETNCTAYDNTPELGMTLRDYFAGQALAGMFSNPDLDPELVEQDCALVAYRTADAMLEVREKKS